MSITIIGGGIQGITTGVLLQSCGYDTRIISEHFSYLDGDDVQGVTTNYAAASIFPVKVEHSGMNKDQLIEAGDSTFREFYRQDNIPVRKQDHYKIYEEDVDIEIPNRMNIESVNSLNQHLVPKRRGKTIQSGYRCEEYFVEMPEYVPLLFEYYQEIGGELRKQSVTESDISDIDGQIINCSGNGSKELFNDDTLIPVRGHLLRLPYDGIAPLNFAYTYTATEYESYTYMYPRNDEIVFGGTYLEGEFDNDGNWKGEDPESLTVTIDGVEIPERLYEVNMDIIRQYVEAEDPNLRVKFGYRPYRPDGVRIEADDEGIIHNYGHGGAGVTLSWWSAQEVLDILDNTTIDLVRIAEQISEYVDS